MKKLFLTSILLFYAAQAAADTTNLCAKVADGAVTTVDLAKKGTTYSEFEAMYFEAWGKPSVATMTPFERVVFSVDQEAFMSWTAFDKMTIRSLAFSTCTLKLAKARR